MLIKRYFAKTFKSFKLLTGFTLVELLVVVALILILIGISAGAFLFFGRESDLNNSAQEITNALKLAQSKTLASEYSSQWGVYFATSTIPHQYTLFRGSSYSARATSSDEVHKLPISTEIKEINLTSGREVVFNKLTGAANQSGKITLRLKDNPSKSREIFVQNSGRITQEEELLPFDTDRIIDSRHIHIDYSRFISTSTESIILTFNGTASTTIVVGDNLKENQIFWEGNVNIGGEIQKIKIQTHRLNNPDTEFSIHRDRRYNNKSLSIKLTSDLTGNLATYSADGLNVATSSIYVTNLQWQ